MASASDNFDRADNAALGANWTEDSGDWQIATNRAVQRTTSGAYRKARYTGTTPATNDFYSEAVCRSPTGGSDAAGVAVRMAASATVTFYAYEIFGGDFGYIVEITAGSEAILDTGAAVTAGTDYTLRLEANGSTLTGTRNGGADTSITDATLTSGHWGLASFGGDNTGINLSWNDWTAADLAVATTSMPIFAARMPQSILAR